MNTITFSINPHGAELSSLRMGEREYLWQGNPAFWGRRAPILFPIVGKVAHDTLRVSGQEYAMKQHDSRGMRTSSFAPETKALTMSCMPPKVARIILSLSTLPPLIGPMVTS